MFRMLVWDAAKALRSLVTQSRLFFILSVATLALGIFASTITSSLIDSFVLSSPPFSDASRLVVLGPTTSSSITTMSPQQYQLLSGMLEFSNIGAVSFRRLQNVTTARRSSLLATRPATRSFLEALGITMTVGRNFTSDEDRPSTATAVIISYRLWTTDFAQNPHVLGQLMKVEGKPMTIVGVLPEGFQFFEPVDLLTPIGLPAHSLDNGNHLTVVARRAPNVSVDHAGAVIEAKIHSHGPELGLLASDRTRFSAVSLQRSLSSEARPVVLLFFSFGSCLLGLVAANLTNLFLVRSIAIQRANAVRQALGASTVRLASGTVAEALLIGILGGAIALVVGLTALPLLNAHIPQNWRNGNGGAAFSWRTYGSACVAALVVPVFVSAIVVRRSIKINLTTELAACHRAGWSPRLRKVGRMLLVMQVALASGLLIIGASFFESLSRLLRMELGIQSTNVATFALQPSKEQYPSGASFRNLARGVMEGIAEMPGIMDATATLNNPVDDNFSIPIRLTTSQQENVQYRLVTPHYFRVLGIPLKRGRDFDGRDMQSNENVAIVNSLYATRYLYENAIGETVATELPATGRPGPMRIIGIVADTRQSGPQQPAAPIVYAPLDQASDELLTEMREFLQLHFLVQGRASVMPKAAIRNLLHQIAPDQAMIKPAFLHDDIGQLTAGEELNLQVAGTMGILAAFVAGLGLYAITTVSFASRRRDLAVHTAMGASVERITSGLLSEVARQVLSGLLAGALIAFAASKLIEKHLAGFSAPTMPALLGTLLALFCISIGTCFRCALTAARINPASLLREL